jgi:hypothetical protein
MAVHVNDPIRLGATFAVSGVNTDPTTVSVTIRDPNGTSTTYTYADDEVQKSATGVYYYDYTPTVGGTYTYEWVGTGTAAGREPGAFHVRPSTV